MKLLINTDLVSVKATDYTDEINLCKKFGIRYSIDDSIELVTFKILVQKITLDSFDINELLCDVFYLFEYEMQYVPLGGQGCDLTLRINSVDDFTQ